MLVDSQTFSLSKLPAFIVIDGVNGAGKSTLQKKIGQYFEERQLKAVLTREPGATSVGKKIRELVLNKDVAMDQRTELLLFAADRAEHVTALIQPTLSRGASVISDRYYYSTIAFQGYGRGISRSVIDVVNGVAINSVLPDLLLLLDLEPGAGLERNALSDEKKLHVGGGDKLELEAREFHVRMRNGFLELASAVTEPCMVVDATQSADAVWKFVHAMLERSFHG